MSSSSDAHFRTAVLRRGEVVDVRPAALGEVTGPIDPRLLEVPKEIIDAAVAEGRRAGYADGYEAGLAQATEEVARLRAEFVELAQRALAALEAAAGSCQERYQAGMLATEQEIAGLAFGLTEALVGRELELAQQPGRDALARALALTTGWGPLRVRLHPDDLATIEDLAGMAPGRDLTVLADPGVERGGCLLEEGAATIDAQVGSALQRVREVLFG